MQILEEQTSRERSISLSKDPKSIQLIIKIQRAWRRIQAKKKLKKKIKKMKAKTQIVNQLLLTERAYCQHMSFILRQVVQPSRSVIDDKQLHEMLFCNLEEIYTMHESFLKAFQEIMKGYSHHKTKISNVTYNQLFGKQNFKQRYSNYCANYKKSNKMAKLLFATNAGFSQIVKKANIPDSKALQSYLIKPMQRLCKYQLLLNNYHKNMQADHPDYNELKQTINFVENLVKQTNEQVQQFLLDEKFKQLQYQFQDVFKRIPNSSRKLLFTIEEINLVNLINDESLLYKQLNLFNDTVFLIPATGTKPIFCPLSIYRDLPNLKYFKNLVQLIHTDKYLTIQFKKDKQKQNFLQAIVKTDLGNKNNDFVQVSIPGTQVRESLFKNYTVYIVQVKFTKDNIRKIYPRFKDLLRVQQMLDSKKIKLNLPQLNKQTVFKTSKSKTIEKRKLIIQEFLQKILNCKECYQVQQIFKFLNLNLDNNKKNLESQLKIQLPNGENLSIMIDAKNSKISQLKEVVAQTLGLIYCSQFQIYEVRNKNNRLMHEDEPVLQIYETQNCFRFNPFKDDVYYTYTRHHYLSPQDEFTLYKNDFVRTELELSVIRSNILKLRLQEELMITFMCLFALYTSLPIHQDSKLSSFIKDIGKKQYKISKQEFRAYYAEVEKKVSSQQDQMITLPFLIIKIISNSPLYRCRQFQVNVHSKCFKSVKGYIQGLEQKIILGIKSSHMLLLTIEHKHIVQSFPMEMVQVKEVHPTAIVLQLNNVGPALRLDTQNAYEISKLFQIYQGKTVTKP